MSLTLLQIPFPEEDSYSLEKMAHNFNTEVTLLY